VDLKAQTAALSSWRFLTAAAASTPAVLLTPAVCCVAQGTEGSACVVTIPRSREVGQSYITSVATTLYSLLYAFQTVATQRPHLVGGQGQDVEDRISCNRCKVFQGPSPTQLPPTVTEGLP
jgi:hypothetical protein